MMKLVCLIIAAGFVAVPASVSQGRVTPGVPAEVPLLLISSSRTSTWATFVATVDGAGVRRLANDTVYDGGAQVSPDGRAVWIDAGESLVLVRPDGTRGPILRDPPFESDISWAPDSSKFAYVRDEVLRVVGLRGELVLELEGFLEHAPVWTADGTKLAAFGADLDRTTLTRAIRVVDVEAGAVQTVANDADALSDLAWRPGSSTLAYESSGDRVVMLDVGTGARRVVSPQGAPFRLFWSPKGDLLAVKLLYGGADVLDASGAHVANVLEGENWRWDPSGRLSYVAAGRRIVATDVRSGRTTTLVAEKTGRRIIRFEWSRSGAELAFDRERLPGVGGDVFVRHSDGTVQQVTSSYPDGGENELVAWMQGPTPGPPPQPRNVRTLEPRPFTVLPAIATLFQGSPRRVFASLAPVWSDVGLGCGTLRVEHLTAFDPCGPKRALLEAAATRSRVMFSLEHTDEGVGDTSAECAYVVNFAVLRLPTLADCDPNNEARPRSGLLRPLQVAEDGSLDIRSAGETFVIGRSYYEAESLSDDVAVWAAGRRLRVIARGTQKQQLVLLDAAPGRALVRRGNRLQLLRMDGHVLSSRPVGARFLDAALDGRRVVVLRSDAIEQLSAITMRRLVRLRMTASWVQRPTLGGAHAGVAAYVRGTVLHVVRFRDRRDVAIRVPRVVPPYYAAVGNGVVTVAVQRDVDGPSGFVGTIPLRDVFR
jgi:Tol biopolymer transport system component